MAFRFHFTGEDLARTRVAGAMAAMVELNVAVRVLRDRNHEARFGAWRRTARGRLGPQARMVLDLVPVHGVSPGFLSPPGARSVAELLEGVAATPAGRIRADLADAAATRPLPGWARTLGEDRDLMRRLVEALGHVHDVLLAPYQASAEDALAADRAVRGRDLLHGGVERLFERLLPGRIHWEAPVLHVELASGLDRDIHLDGRGLLLVPSVFVTGAPVVIYDTEPQPMLVHPAHQPTGAGVLAAPHGSSPALDALLGRTRAAVLRTFAQREGCTTGDVAAAVRISAASASEHTTVLRAAGLVTTLRDRNTAIHTATAAGLTLLAAATG
ncbi:winged helix-turn-helix domain-containing protein [Kitasatospora sp. SC0581]|uniref:winged helix-turn-helix domain-containing protein n=1 Tax=Kitasatospora sp. SC0581 TaxID=3394360 RepID=UPI003A8B4F3B